MSSDKRRNTRNKSNLWQSVILIVVCFLLCFLFIGGITYARYVDDWSGRLNTDVAQWNIKVNGISLADTAAASKIDVELITVKDGVDTPSAIIEPGQSGYFEITINPCATEATATEDATPATEVSFTYTITVNTDAFPDGMSITGYSISNKSSVLATGTAMTVTRTVELPSGSAFTENDIHTVRFNWSWGESSEYDEDTKYFVSVSVSAEQYFGGQTA